MKINTQNSESGMSLLEVGVSVGVVVLVLIGLISAVTQATAAAQFARNKATATKYAQEAMEWLRGQRESSWTAFYDRANSTTYHMNCDLYVQTTWCNSGGGVIDDEFDIFDRQVTLTRSGITGVYNDDSVHIQVVVSWPQGSRTEDVILETDLTKWQ
ncbi:hypothetical protein C4579_02715 [Candidatus Microgenomates bacterium]|nr:MAG: hypothetical protein C4579_02715 [Candidatus Microgenomates bacterium]